MTFLDDLNRLNKRTDGGTITIDQMREMEAVAARLEAFVTGYEQMRGTDPEVVYAIHTGTDRAAAITMGDLRRSIAALRGE